VQGVLQKCGVELARIFYDFLFVLIWARLCVLSGFVRAHKLRGGFRAFVRAHKLKSVGGFCKDFLRIFVGPLFGLHKPFFAAGDCVIIASSRPAETVGFWLISLMVFAIILLHTF
jgi:hypothetical protein